MDSTCVCAGRQIEHFVENNSGGLIRVALSWINQFIEAFVYCVLGGQVKARSTKLSRSL